MPLTWTNTFKTGIPEIDEQHKELINSMNELLDALQRNDSPQVIQGILSRLSSCANLHFGYEETCMNRYRCPVAEKNKLLHAQFIKTFGEIRRELIMNGSSNTVAGRIDKELLDWFGQHIKGIDTQLKPCMDKA
ncbi:bacteriohemerythrin [Prochlorothrix hollandica]|uniref:Hemerythrin-like domain-containing protein n=1 Tax=Prochlorothrix hollandica PCC 9006 = CALU 1027 TaxID=317619 RepID=A0A0M2PUP3_PROHO|nr:hemerythrin family protein [Prochlorothrix hollandica]KKJ00231.1 hypothetical protein PROH_11085 [Prochlorothrix hollandica PCC 9006 = CALU 1027]